MEFKKLAKKRYSCRDLKSEKIDQDIINTIIETAIAAPTAVNRQAFKIFILDSEQAKKNIKEVTKWTFGAETFLLVAYKEKDAWTRKYDNHNFAEIDASIVATHVMLQIEDLGLGTTWVGHFDAPKLKELYPEMRDYELIAIFPVSYPKDDAKPSDRHFQRKSKEELVERL